MSKEATSELGVRLLLMMSQATYVKNLVRVALVYAVFALSFAFHNSAAAFKPTADYGHRGITEQVLREIRYQRTGSSRVWRFAPRGIETIITANIDVDHSSDFLRDVPHCDNESLYACSLRLLSLKTDALIKLRSSPPNGPAARKLIGRALHTLQDFYAHSNWANISSYEHSKINANLGIKAITAAAAKEFTCDADGSVLRNFGLSKNTSGYFSLGSQLFIPKLGKCLHGATDVLVEGLDVIDGINKDTPARPFHYEARKLAAEATRNYIQQILDANLDDQQLDALFNVRADIAFVVDTTSSMGPIIEGIKGSIRKIIEETKNSEIRPARYILVLYKDPKQDQALITGKPDDVLDALGKATAEGGGDCQEPTFDSILTALMLVAPGSSVYAFTDASAKDSVIETRVRAQARKKLVTVHINNSGSCSPTDRAYFTLTSSTGGQLYVWNKKDQGDADVTAETERYFASVKPELSGDAEPLLMVEDKATSSTRVHQVPVDNTVSELTWSVAFAEKGGLVVVKDPTGRVVRNGYPNSEFTTLSQSTIIHINDPKQGTWTLEIRTASTTSTPRYSAFVKGKSPLSFATFEFVEMGGRPEHQGLFPIAGLPSLGRTATARAEVNGEVSEVHFEFTKLGGEKLKSITLQLGQPDAETSYLGDVQVPQEVFRVAARGKTKSGAPFIRSYPRTFVARPVQVHFLDRDAELIAGQTFHARIQVENMLTEPNSYVLSVVNDAKYLTKLSSTSLALDAGEKRLVEVDISVPVDTQELETVTLTAMAAPWNATAQFNSDVVELSMTRDQDGDGVSDTLEQGPAGVESMYDGNGDGIADAAQGHVASFFSGGMHTYVTLAAPENVQLRDVSANKPQAESAAPAELTLPFGAMGFRVETGHIHDIELVYFLPFEVDGYSAWIQDTSSSAQSAWQSVKSSRAKDNIVRFRIEDGARDDLSSESGIIVHTGGPHFKLKGSSGGGCAVTTTPVPPSTPLVFSLLLWWKRRKRNA